MGDSLTQAEARKARLAEELRANLARRKAQARARRLGKADDREGIGAAGKAAPDEAEPSPHEGDS